MTQFTGLSSDFVADGMVGRVKRSNPRLDAFDAAIYTQKLYSIYGAGADAALKDAFTVEEKDGKMETVIKPEMIARGDVQAAITIFQDISDFAKQAARVLELHAPGVTWAPARAGAEQIDETFRFWLASEVLRASLTAALADMDNPNGVEAGVLTPEQRQDPLSVPVAASTGTA